MSALRHGLQQVLASSLRNFGASRCSKLPSSIANPWTDSCSRHGQAAASSPAALSCGSAVCGLQRRCELHQNQHSHALCLYETESTNREHKQFTTITRTRVL